MLSRNDIERLAGAAHALRPDWPVSSLCTWLLKDHAARAFQDVAVALAYVAADPGTKTPKRMNELGPWWGATSSGRASQPLHYDRCPIDGHTSYPANNCGYCRAEQIEATPGEVKADPEATERNRAGRELVRAALRKGK